MAIKCVKIKRVLANNRKRCFQVEANNKRYEFPYWRLELQPTSEDPIASVYVDPELAKNGFTYVLKSGREDSVVFDQILDFIGDPEYLLKLHIHNLTCKALRIIKEKKLKKREIARQLGTSPKQLYRLLQTAFYGKTVNQMFKLLHVLGHEVEITVTERKKVVPPGKKKAA